MPHCKHNPMRWFSTLPYALIIIAIFEITACSGQQIYDQCEAPNDHLEIMFKAKTVSPFSHAFCIVCNPQLEPEEYGPWAIEMGAPQAPENTDDLVPCLYVYQPGANIESRKECVSLVCEDGADYNDMVNDKQNGNFDLGPLLNGN